MRWQIVLHMPEHRRTAARRGESRRDAGANCIGVDAAGCKRANLAAHGGDTAREGAQVLQQGKRIRGKARPQFRHADTAVAAGLYE
jgi:hypothetical protein